MSYKKRRIGYSEAKRVWGLLEFSFSWKNRKRFWLSVLENAEKEMEGETNLRRPCSWGI